jgi:hypothetical protein
MIVLVMGLMASSIYAVDRENDFSGLIRSNVMTTDFSALVKVDRITRSGPEQGYATWYYEATVLESWVGPEMDRIQYRQTVDADMPVRVPEKPQIVSLCGSQKRGFYIPDNGFMLPATKHLEVIAGTAAEQRRRADVRKESLGGNWCN